MRVHRLYADAQGETHFETVEIALTDATRAGQLSAPLPVKGLIFREVSPDYDLDWHTAPRRQYIVNLEGGVEITASDGEVRRIGAGEILLVEDTRGKGHRSRALDGKPRRGLLITLE